MTLKSLVKAVQLVQINNVLEIVDKATLVFPLITNQNLNSYSINPLLPFSAKLLEPRSTKLLLRR